MAEPIHDKIKRSLQAAEGLYHRLVLLVGEDRFRQDRRSSILPRNSAHLRRQRQSALSGELPSRRASGVASVAGHPRSDRGPAQAPVVLDNLEILFDGDLQQTLAPAAVHFEKSGRGGFRGTES